VGNVCGGRGVTDLVGRGRCVPVENGIGAGSAMNGAISRESEYRRILKSFDVFGLSTEHRTLIREALDSNEWDWFQDCDGCTAVSELHWPTKYFPPCLRHDFDCIRGNGDPSSPKGYAETGWGASRRFYALQRAYGVPVWRAALRTGAVTAFWYAWRRWRR